MGDRKGKEGVRVFFIGAGPGDPELLTLKGKRILQEADLAIYAGSLVNPETLAYTKEGAELYDSASLTLEEIFHWTTCWSIGKPLV